MLKFVRAEQRGKRHVIQNTLVEVILHECAIEEYCKTIAFALLTELERFTVTAQVCMIWGIIQNFIFGRIKELHSAVGLSWRGATNIARSAKACGAHCAVTGGEVSNRLGV